MKNRLSRVRVAIEHRPITCVGVPGLACDRRGPCDHRADDIVVVRCELVERGDVATRDDQHVGRGLRVDVPEGNQSLVFVNDVGRYLVIDDPAEEAVWHGVGNVSAAR